MKYFIFYTIFILFELFTSCSSNVQRENKKGFGDIALQQSTIPVRPGNPGKVPFWNKYAKRFIYAPAFDYNKINGATKYRYDVFSFEDSSAYSFKDSIPYAPLSPVWAQVPVGNFELKVVGISKNGDSLGLAGSGAYYRASPFDPDHGNVYHKPIMPYDSSAMLALDSLLHKDYVSYWLMHDLPDPNYFNYQYPAKIWSALIVGAVAYSKMTSDSKEIQRSVKLAKIVADHLLEVSFPEGFYLAYFPPTYYGKWIATRKLPYIRLDNSMPMYGARAGNAYLDLYEITRDNKYLQAAKKIANTYVNTQLKNGTWYLYVDPKTGQPTAGNVMIPAYIINYLNRLSKDYKMEGLKKVIQKAVNWIMDNPVKTFNWQGQFEDIGAHIPYKNLSREQACDVAVYLFKNKKNIPLAEELVRFAEDQFVIWEKPRNLNSNKSNLGAHSANWITPCVQEQYYFWMPVTRSAGIMIQTYWEAYLATKKDIYLAKAKSIANALTLVQKVNGGDYLTFFTKYAENMGQWLNSTVYPAKIMMDLQNNLDKLK